MMIFQEKAFYDAHLNITADKVLYSDCSSYQHILVIENKIYGKVLILDGLFQTSTFDEHFYHEMIVHPAIAMSEKIGNVLIIGGGDGGTAKRVLSYKEVKNVRLVEIDQMVVDPCKEYLPSIGNNSWNDKRLEVIITDGKDYIKSIKDWNPNSIDLIIIDGSDPVGPAEVLFQQEFFENCYQALTEKGTLVTQTGSPYLMEDSFYSIYKSLSNTFEITKPYFGPVPLYPGGYWSYMLSVKNDRFIKNPKRIYEIEDKCKYYNRYIHDSCFVLPENIMEGIKNV